LEIGDISFKGELILDINENYMLTVPIDSILNMMKSMDTRSYSIFTMNGKEMYAKLWLMDKIDSKIYFTPYRNVDKEVCDKIINEYLKNYLRIGM